jgi:hypothetical protein
LDRYETSQERAGPVTPRLVWSLENSREWSIKSIKTFDGTINDPVQMSSGSPGNNVKRNHVDSCSFEEISGRHGFLELVTACKLFVVDVKLMSLTVTVTTAEHFGNVAIVG